MGISSLLLLFLLTLSGSALALFFEKAISRYLGIVLAFSGAFLLGITVTHMFPHLFGELGSFGGACILFGFIIQILIESISKGIEHGHYHITEDKFFPWSIFIGLALHSFLEGIPLTEKIGFESINIAVYYGVIMHKVPAAFVLMAVLVSHHVRRGTIALILMIFAAMTPLGAIAGNLVFKNMNGAFPVFTLVIGIISGSFLYIATTILYEASDKHQYNLQKSTAIIIGFIIAYFLI